MALVLLAEGAAVASNSDPLRREATAALSPLLVELEPAARRLAQLLLALGIPELDSPADALGMLSAISADSTSSTLERTRADLAAAAILRRSGDRRGAGRLLAELSARTPEEELFTHLLIADQRSLLLEELDGDPQQAWLPYRTLLNQARPSLRPSLRPLLLARTAALVSGPPRPSVEKRVTADPAEVGKPASPATEPAPFVALATLLARAGQSDPGGLELGLTTILEHSELPPMERSIASLALGELRLAAGDAEGAAAVLLEAASRNRGEPESIECAERAAETVTALWNTQPKSQSLRDLAARTYDRLLRDFPDLPRQDSWRIEAARLALQDGRAAQVEALLGPIGPSASADASARVLRLEAQAWGARGAPAAERRQAWQRLLERIDTQAADGARQDESAVSQAVILLRAEALLGIDAAVKALEILDALPTLDDALDAHAWNLTLQALRGAGRLEEAPRRAAARTEADQRAHSVAVLTAMLLTLEEECRQREGQGWSAEAELLGRSEMVHLAEAILAGPAALPLPDATARAAPGAAGVASGRREAVALHAAARGLLRGDRPGDALRLVDQILAEEPETAELLLTRAECLQRLGSSLPADESALAEAMAILKRVSASRRAERDRAFWLAEALQFEILLHLRRNLDQIAPRVAQLRLLDPALGGEGSRRRLEAAAAAAAAAS